MALHELLPAIYAEAQYRKECADADTFCAPMAHFSTWLNQRRWEQQFPEVTPAAGGKKKLTQAQKDHYDDSVEDVQA